jgi:sugar phosphate permease
MSSIFPSKAFILKQWRFLLFGFLLAFFSGPGQTFYISLFSSVIREDLTLSHGEFGTLYAIGTLASAATLIPLGRLVDTIRLRIIAFAIILCLALASMFFSFVGSVAMLALGIYFLRLSGQGMMTHLYATAMTRRYVAERGRALAFATLGHPVSEFLMPLFALALLALFDWRQVWQITAVIVLIIMIPASLALTQRREGQDGGGLDAMAAGRDGQHWTRKEMLLHWRFWMLAGIVIAPSFTATGLFFHQIYIAEQKGVALDLWVSGYAFYASMSILGAFLGGGMADRFTSARTTPFAVMSLTLIPSLLYAVGSGVMIYIYFIVFGLIQGMVHTVATPIWAEIYGTKHLGGIKAITAALMVFASAMSPVTLGLMIDSGYPFASLLLVLASVPLLAGISGFIAVNSRN